MEKSRLCYLHMREGGLRNTRHIAMATTQIMPLRDIPLSYKQKSASSFHAHFLNVWASQAIICPLIRPKDVTGGKQRVRIHIPYATKKNIIPLLRIEVLLTFITDISTAISTTDNTPITICNSWVQRLATLALHGVHAG